MTRQQKTIRVLFAELKRAKLHYFPKAGQPLDAPNKQGVYIIYSPRLKKVLHVGRTYRGTNGLWQRLKNHLHGSSSFTDEHFHGEGRKLRRGYAFRYVTVHSPRHRALLEYYASGCLCPVHLGTSDAKKKKNSR